MARGIFFCGPGEAVPDEFPLWLERRSLDAGSALELGADHGDEALYVLDGEVEVDGRRCPGGGAVVVEAGVPAVVRATAPTTVVHVGRAGGPTTGGAQVHVVGPGGTWASVGEGRDTRYFADAECPTCDLVLFVTGRDHEYVSAPHSHSSDELLHVLTGEVHVGRRVLGPGSTVAVAAGVRYGFRSPGFSFLNYRPHVATITRDGVTAEEGGRAHGFDPVMDLR